MTHHGQNFKLAQRKIWIQITWRREPRNHSQNCNSIFVHNISLPQVVIFDNSRWTVQQIKIYISIQPTGSGRCRRETYKMLPEKTFAPWQSKHMKDDKKRSQFQARDSIDPMRRLPSKSLNSNIEAAWRVRDRERTGEWWEAAVCLCRGDVDWHSDPRHGGGAGGDTIKCIKVAAVSKRHVTPQAPTTSHHRLE